jgi:hypothetical protein
MARKKADDVFQPSGEVRRIISLAQGEWAYVFDMDGRMHHVRTTSDEFKELTADERFNRDKERLGLA